MTPKNKRLTKGKTVTLSINGMEGRVTAFHKTCHLGYNIEIDSFIGHHFHPKDIVGIDGVSVKHIHGKTFEIISQ